MYAPNVLCGFYLFFSSYYTHLTNIFQSPGKALEQFAQVLLSKITIFVMPELQ